MRIFVSEFVCGGAWPGEPLPASLAREGRAMWQALVEDCSRIPGAEVVTTWDARLGESPLRHCDVRVVTSTHEEELAFRQFVRASDVVWVVAPETGRQLERRRLLFDESLRDVGASRHASQTRFIGPTLSACQLTADKLALSEFLNAHGLATPPTKTLDLEEAHEAAWPFPLVIKPRDGAGSQHTHWVRSKVELHNIVDELRRIASGQQFVQQPFIAGQALSVALLIAEDGSICETLRVAEQHLSQDGRFCYLGGRLPADISLESATAVQRLAEQACRAVPGLTGYVGCDLILPDDRPTEPVLIEINPRLTSSYLGYRQLTDDNLAGRLLNSIATPLRWKPQSIAFRV